MAPPSNQLVSLNECWAPFIQTPPPVPAIEAQPVQSGEELKTSPSPPSSSSPPPPVMAPPSSGAPVVAAGASRVVMTTSPEPAHYAGVGGLILIILLVILIVNASTQARKIEALEVRLDMLLAAGLARK